MFTNRRKKKRFSVNLSVTLISVQGSKENIVAFTTKNISEAGLLVQAPTHFKGQLNEEFDLILLVNKKDPQQNIHFTARIVYQDTADHLHGMEIIRINNDEMQKMRRLIDQITPPVDLA